MVTNGLFFSWAGNRTGDTCISIGGVEYLTFFLEWSLSLVSLCIFSFLFPPSPTMIDAVFLATIISACVTINMYVLLSR